MDGVLVDDVVWARLNPQEPWWPCQVRPMEKAPKKVRKFYKPDRLLLQFFAEKSWAFLRHKDLRPFANYRARCVFLGIRHDFLLLTSRSPSPDGPKTATTSFSLRP